MQGKRPCCQYLNPTRFLQTKNKKKKIVGGAEKNPKTTKAKVGKQLRR